MTGERPLKIGLHIDTGEYPEDFAFSHTRRERTPDRWADIAAMALAAEEVGFDSIWIPDHLLYRLVEDKQEGNWECFTMLSALAAITTRVHIGVIVVCTAWRNPALIAKMADTIDEISNGRLILGLGAGWHDPEFEAFGYPTNYRYSRFKETLQIIHGLLRHGHLDFDGQFHSVQNCDLRPRGPRPEGPPILIGTTGHKMLRLTARYADIWHGIIDHNGKDRFDAYETVRQQVDEACVEVGRDPATLQRSLTQVVNSLNRAEFQLASGGNTIGGPAVEISETLRSYADAGISELTLTVAPATIEGIEAMGPVLEELDRGGISRLS